MALERSHPILGESRAMQELDREINIVARSDLTVLLMDMTGVGKKVLVRIIHSRSLRSQPPLVHVNCAALPELLGESELFGHVRGAFTGASRYRIGKFELVDGGTLFLDKVCELPLAIQTKLLRAVQFGEIQRVGTDGSHQVDILIIAATNRLLPVKAKEGRFLADLYHRLSIYTWHVPPLRERVKDIANLAGHFLEQFRIRLGLSRFSMTPATIRRQEEYDWPRNVRELEHVMLRAALRATDAHTAVAVIEPLHLDGLGHVDETPRQSVSLTAESKGSLAKRVDGFQAQLIRSTLLELGDNWAETARRLQIDLGNLHRLAKRLGLKGSG